MFAQLLVREVPGGARTAPRQKGAGTIEWSRALAAGGEHMKRKDVTREALHRAALRSTRASAALENRSVPVGVTRSERVERFLAARK